MHNRRNECLSCQQLREGNPVLLKLNWNFHWDQALVCLRRSPSTTEQEQDLNCHPHKELPIHTGHEFDSHLQGMLCSYTLTLLGQESTEWRPECNRLLAFWEAWSKSHNSLQLIISPVKDSPLFSVPGPDLTLSKSKQLAWFSRLQSHLLAAMIPNAFQTSSRP